MLQATVDKAPVGDIKIVMGDMNAKIGADNSGKEDIMGKQALGEMNENGEIFTDFCAFNNLVIGGSIFPHKDIHKATWISPDGKTRNQIDHITVASKWRRSLQDTRAMRGADAASDHHLVMGTMKIKLRAFKDSCSKPHIKYNTQKLGNKEIRKTFSITLKNKFEALTKLNTTEETTLDENWNKLKTIWTETCQQCLGRRSSNNKGWISTETLNLEDQRRKLKQIINSSKDREEEKRIREEYADTNKKSEKKCSQRQENPQ